MKYTEIISVRLASGKALDEAIMFCRETLKAIDPGQFELYRDTGHCMDLSVHIYWNSLESGQDASPLGRMLTKGLSEYGLVNHCMWMAESGTAA